MSGQGAGRSRTVAVMQPYFFPYAGYFRLLAAADLFVILDCVQFPRRGRVHRCEVPGRGGGTEWLTLPLAHQGRDALIRDLEFAAGAREEFDRRLARFAWIAGASGPAAAAVRQFLSRPFGPVIDYLESGLRLIAELLDFDTGIVRSSHFAIDDSIHGQDRVIAIASAAGAERYVNAPGGRKLYDSAAFARAGIELCFLEGYEGRYRYMLPGLLTEPPPVIRRDILETAVIAD